MMGKLLFVTGLAVGYVLGARAGRPAYDRISSNADKVWNDPHVQSAVSSAEDYVNEKAPIVADKLKEAAGVAAAKAKDAAGAATGKAKESASRAASRAKGAVDDGTAAAL
jgi:hypothetical protein